MTRFEGRPVTFNATAAPGTQQFTGKPVVFSTIATYFAVCDGGRVMPARPGMVDGLDILWLAPELY